MHATVNQRREVNHIDTCFITDCNCSSSATVGGQCSGQCSVQSIHLKTSVKINRIPTTKVGSGSFSPPPPTKTDRLDEELEPTPKSSTVDRSLEMVREIISSKLYEKKR
ncbi:hypothetical protein CDAR_459661 [Caerostris darwini]|uniref:Uncharacterized protein n=1 Tax=Caerostris darwini TaxID=1538125 RepID=A0AAV4UTB2_9ARAC|nr:hypothetical protein CDAR_459661 [Caerostris darwini]